MLTEESKNLDLFFKNFKDNFSEYFKHVCTLEQCRIGGKPYGGMTQNDCGLPQSMITRILENDNSNINLRNVQPNYILTNVGAYIIRYDMQRILPGNIQTRQILHIHKRQYETIGRYDHNIKQWVDNNFHYFIIVTLQDVNGKFIHKVMQQYVNVQPELLYDDVPTKVLERVLSMDKLSNEKNNKVFLGNFAAKKPTLYTNIYPLGPKIRIRFRKINFNQKYFAMALNQTGIVLLHNELKNVPFCDSKIGNFFLSFFKERKRVYTRSVHKTNNTPPTKRARR